MPARTCPDIPAATLAAAQLEAFNTLRALATNLANAHQARLAAMAILSLQPHAPAAPLHHPSRSAPAASAAPPTSSPRPSSPTPARSPSPAPALSMHDVLAGSLDSPALPALLDSMAALPAIPPQAPRTSAETRALIARLDRFLQTPLATPERVQKLLAKSGKG